MCRFSLKESLKMRNINDWVQWDWQLRSVDEGGSDTLECKYYTYLSVMTDVTEVDWGDDHRMGLLQEGYENLACLERMHRLDPVEE